MWFWFFRQIHEISERIPHVIIRNARFSLYSYIYNYITDTVVEWLVWWEFLVFFYLSAHFATGLEKVWKLYGTFKVIFYKPVGCEHLSLKSFFLVIIS